MASGPGVGNPARKPDRYLLTVGFDVTGEITILDQENEFKLYNAVLSLWPATGKVTTGQPPLAPPMIGGSSILDRSPTSGSTGFSTELTDSLDTASRIFLSNKESGASIVIRDFSTVLRLRARTWGDSSDTGFQEFSARAIGLVYLKAFQTEDIDRPPVGPSSPSARPALPKPECALDRVGVYAIVLDLESPGESHLDRLSQVDLRSARVNLAKLSSGLSPLSPRTLQGWDRFLSTPNDQANKWIGLYDFATALAWERICDPVRTHFLARVPNPSTDPRSEESIKSYRKEYYEPKRFATVVHELRETISLDSWILPDEPSHVDEIPHSAGGGQASDTIAANVLKSIGCNFKFTRARIQGSDLILDRTLVSIPRASADLEGRSAADWAAARLGVAVFLLSFLVFESDLFTLSGSRAENLAYQLFDIQRHGIIAYSESEERATQEANKARELHLLERESVYLLSEFLDKYRFGSVRVQDELESMRVWLGVRNLYESLEKRMDSLVRFQRLEAEAEERKSDKQRNQMILLLTIAASVLAAYQPLTSIWSGYQQIVSELLLGILIVVWVLIGVLFVPQIFKVRDGVRPSSKAVSSK